MMKKYLITLLGLLLLLGCSTNKNRLANKEAFVNFTNNNKTGIKRDNETIKDKEFMLKIPNCLTKQQNKISHCFFQKLMFKNNQEIIAIYLPDNKYKTTKKANFYYRDDFKKILLELDILKEVEDISFIKNRCFNILLLDDNFFIMYINVKNKNVDDFNYSINSINIKKT